MKFLKDALQYLFVLEKGKRFLILLLLGIPVGLATSFVIPTTQFLDFGERFKVGNADFWSNWNLGGSGYTFWFGLLIAFVIWVFTYAIASNAVSRNMRVGGALATKRLMQEFNEGFFPALYAALTYIVAFLVLKIILALTLSLWALISNYHLAIAISSISLILVLFLSLAFLSITAVYSPVMTIKGVKPKSAFFTSARKCASEFWGLMFAFGAPVVAVLLIGFGISFLKIPLLSVIIDTAFFGSLFAYFVALNYTAYYSLEGLERKDFPREFFYRDVDKIVKRKIK